MNGSEAWKLDEHWKVINSGGRVISNTPKQLWEQAVDYFKWCDENPIKAKQTLKSGKEASKQMEVEYKRPYTIKAFCLHAGISERYITDIKNSHALDSEWVMVMEKILYIIYNQNLEGGLVNLYNPIMVSKVLNLDKEPGDNEKPPRVEIVEPEGKKSLANSENEVLKKLDFGKVEELKDKLENL